MITLRQCRLAGVAVGAAALIVPASAAAHGSVWESTALVNCTATPNPPLSPADVTCASQKRYVFSNHGATYVLRETNGKTTAGAINYQRAPGLLRNAPGFNVFASDATTGAHPHATCDVAALSDGATIRSWQGTDPFYAYVPFQKAAVGLEDDPASWLPVVQAKTGLDLTAIPDAGLEAACEGLPGANPNSYVPADETQTTFTALASLTIEHETAPLLAEIASLKASRGTQAPDLRSAYDAAQQEIKALQADLKPLRLALPASTPSVDALVKDGIALTMTGPAKRTVTVRLKVSAPWGKKLRLRSRILAGARVVLDADGKASFTLKPGNAAATKLSKATTDVPFAVDATSGDRFNLVSATAGG